jgi:biopolymer transport protein ExbD
MKIKNPLPGHKTRLEIIPLIDIMFFLLASFMMVSIQMQVVRTLKASLPTATLAPASKKPDIVNLTVERDGRISLDHQPIGLAELYTVLTNRLSTDTNLPVYLTGVRDTTHGNVMFALDWVRRAGVQRVALAVKAPAGN